MKKKISCLLAAAICAFGCVFCFTACQDDGSDTLLGVRIATADNPSEKTESLTGKTYTYGDSQIDNWHNEFKFFKQYGDGHYKEAALTELNVEYTLNGEDATEASVCEPGDHTITLSIPGTTNTSSISFTVDKAHKDGFSMSVSASAWNFTYMPASVTVKNHANTVMKASQSYHETSKFSDADDSEFGCLYVYAVSKENYEAHKEDAKNYSRLTAIDNSGENPYFSDGFFTNYYTSGSEFPLELTPGTYMLIGCIDETVHYKEIVCPAVEVTVTLDEPYGKTFVLTDVEATGPSAEDEAPIALKQIAEKFKTDNLNHTAKCAAPNQVVTGTCNFGYKPLDDLTGDEAYRMTFDTKTLFVTLSNATGNLTGSYRGGKLVIWMPYSAGENANGQLFFTFEIKDVA